MKSPWFGTGTALNNLFATRSFVYADLYTITTSDGTTKRYAALDQDVTASSMTWSHSGPAVERTGKKSTLRWSRGLDVNTMSLTVTPRAVDPLSGTAFPDEILGEPWVQAAVAGILDNGTVQLDRAYAASWPQRSIVDADITAIVTMFFGNIVDVQAGRTLVTIDVNSLTELFNIQMPRNVFQSGCRHNLFDGGCTLSQSSFKMSGTVSAVSPTSGITENQFKSTLGAPGGSGTYALGWVKFTSGASSGFRVMVRDWNNGSNVWTLMRPLPLGISVGDSFDAYPGCDKTMDSCIAFSNISNFGGFPFIPDAMTAV